MAGLLLPKKTEKTEKKFFRFFGQEKASHVAIEPTFVFLYMWLRFEKLNILEYKYSIKKKKKKM